MKRTFVRIVLAIGVLSIAAVVSAGDEPQERLASMDWLEGRWTGPADEGTWEAIYSGTDGGTILSLNKQIVDGRAVLIEFERFVVQDAEVVMIPAPGGRPSDAHFTLTEYEPEARRAVFSNPEHDFPQRITYHRTDDRTLTIDVEAEREGSVFGFRLTLTRQGPPAD